jgi:hypothetical protein
MRWLMLLVAIAAMSGCQSTHYARNSRAACITVTTRPAPSETELHASPLSPASDLR